MDQGSCPRKPYMQTIIDHLIDHKKAYFIATLVAIVLMMSMIRHPGFDSAFENLGIQNNVYIDDAPYIDSVFNEKQKVFVEIVSKHETFGAVVADMKEYQDNLQQLFPELQFRSPVGFAESIYGINRLNETPVSEVLTRLSNVDVLKDVIGIDTSSFLVVLGIDKDKQDIVAEKLDKAWTSVQNKDKYIYRASGLALLENAMNETLQRDILFILIILFICFALIMYVSYRSKFATSYLLGMVTASLIAGIFVYVLSGYPFTFVGIMVLPVVVVLAAANAVHLMTGYFSIKEGTHDEKIRKIYNKYLVPSFLTTITTSFAFFTLTLTTTKSVYTLGWVCGVTILISFAICFSVTPFVMQYAPKRNIKDHPFTKAANFFIKNKKVFAICLIPVLFISLFLLPHLTFKNNFELFIPENSQAKMDFEEIRSNYNAQSDLNILIKGTDSLETINEVKRINELIKGVDGVESVFDRTMHSIIMTPLMIPVDLAATSEFKDRYEASLGRFQRLQIRTKTSQDLVAAEAKINQIIESVPSSFEIMKSSSELMYEYVNREVGASLIKSMLSSSIFLFFVFLILTRSLLQSIIGLFVNVVPLSMIVILFVGLDLQLNIMTALTAIVCLGLIVDDTIHSFYRRVIMRQKLNELSFGMLTTTIILTAGFGVFAISSLQPVVIFGGIAAIIFVITLISDFTLLLYLIDLYDRKIGFKDKK